jgi:hypothetical protein
VSLAWINYERGSNDVLKTIIDWFMGLIRGRRQYDGSARSGATAGENHVQATAVPAFYLSDHEIETIKANREDYAFATKAVGPWPWIVLPPIHKREVDLARRGQEPGAGPFAVDPPGSGQQVKEIRAYVLGVYAKYGYRGDPDLDRDFRGACLVAAHILRERMGGASFVVNGAIDDDALKEAYWAYNGRGRFCTPWALDPIHGKPDDKEKFVNRKAIFSGYVMNDPARGFRLWCHGTLPPLNPGEPDREKTWRDDRPGTFVLYRELVARSAEICA